MVLIKNAYIKTMAGADIPSGEILIDDSGKIEEVAEKINAPEGTEIIDAEGRLTTPGCIDAHSHIGIINQGMRWEGSDHNEAPDPVTSHMRALDGFDPLDKALPAALKGGVTTACACPGSMNVVGGTVVVTKLAGKRIDDMVVKAEAAMKCAFGENPKNFHGQAQGKSPKTRMAIAALLRELLFKSREYLEAKENGSNPKFDMKLEAMIPVMKGEIPLKAHAHRADDIFTAIRIAKEFNVKLTLDHCTEGSLIAEELAKEGYPALVGPTMSSISKPELLNKEFETVGNLSRAGVKVCIITDAPVISQDKLTLCAGLAVNAGLDIEEGWRAITINPAEVLGVSDRIGSLEKGKDADIVIWTANPLTTIGGKAFITIVDGKIVYRA